MKGQKCPYQVRLCQTNNKCSECSIYLKRRSIDGIVNDYVQEIDRQMLALLDSKSPDEE